MSNYRVFVEKYPEFQVEARSLLSELNENLQLNLGTLRFLNVYDLFGFSEELLEKSRYSVFGEIVTDKVTDECDLEGTRYIAVECLPGQFDQQLLNIGILQFFRISFFRKVLHTQPLESAIQKLRILRIENGV